MQKQKEIIIVNDHRVVKILNKKFTQRILDCFHNEPKTASEIANSISFPKEKIYYHLKNLVSNDILFVPKTKKIQGIDQKFFYPTAKIFQTENHKPTQRLNKNEDKDIGQNKKLEEKSLKSYHTDNKKEIKRYIKERRRNSTRRVNDRRSLSERRRNLKTNYKKKDKRKLQTRRSNYDRRITDKRRSNYERRNLHLKSQFNDKQNKTKRVIKFSRLNKSKHQNLYLFLNGIKRAISFVQCGDRVTYLYCALGRSGFEIKKINSYKLPIQIKNRSIDTLTELIINVYHQIIDPNKNQKIYLAVYSDKYECEMTYVQNKGKNKNLFRKNLLKILNSSYDINEKESLLDYTNYKHKQKNAVVCYSNKKIEIERDYKSLKKSNIQLRYITSIPKILNNVYTYYNLGKSDETSLLIYIGQTKTHFAFIHSDQLIESQEIHKGLVYFAEKIADLSLTRVVKDEAISEALHFLSYYGIGPDTSFTNIQDGFPFKKAKSIIQHLISSFTEHVKDVINYFENIAIEEHHKKVGVQKIYIAGPGSHIKGFGEKAEQLLDIPVKNLSLHLSKMVKHGNEINSSLYKKIKEKNLFRNKDRSESNLSALKQKIKNHEEAIQTVETPESAKYTLARLEIEKNSRLSSVNSASKKLIQTSKEFKVLKNDFVLNQDTLSADLESIQQKLEIKSNELYDKYKEYDETNKHISELEFQFDQSKTKKEKARLENRNVYSMQIKSSSQDRSKLINEKESLEQEIELLEGKILEDQDLFQTKNIKIENGQDEIATLEYIKDSTQNIANAFKRSFLDHLQQVEDITKEDISTLQKSGYLINNNTKRLDEIIESFLNVASEKNTGKNTQFFDPENSIEIRKKCIEILKLIKRAPDNLIHLRNLSSTIEKINKDQIDLKIKKQKLSNQILESKREIKNHQKSKVSIKKDIAIHENDLDEKVNYRTEKLDYQNYIRKQIEMNHEFLYNQELLKEIVPRRKIKIEELKKLDEKINIIDSSMRKNKEVGDKLEIDKAELNHSLQISVKRLDDDIEEYDKNIDGLELQLIENRHKQEEVSTKIDNVIVYIDELEKQCVKKKENLEYLHKKKLPIIKKTKDDKTHIQDVYSKKLKTLEQEKRKNLANAQKTKKVTINAFFKKEKQNLDRELATIQREMVKNQKEKDKAIAQRNKYRDLLAEVKKKKNPIIQSLTKQIKKWESDLKRGRKIQERLDSLEIKKRDWDQLINKEEKEYSSQKHLLEKNITRKTSNEYHAFIVNGLKRFKNDGDKKASAIKMIQESIDLDKDEIKRLEDGFKKFKSKYDSFLIRYKKNYKNILDKLKPFGGKRKIIIAKIRASKDKLISAESMIRKHSKILDDKNDNLLAKEKEFLDREKSYQDNMASIKEEIRNLPLKQQRSINDIDKQISQIPINTAREKLALENEMKEDFLLIDINLENSEIMLNIKKIEDEIVYNFKEIEESNNQKNNLDQDLNKLIASQGILEKKLQKFSEKTLRKKSNILKIKEQFNINNSGLIVKIDSNKEEYLNLKIKIEELDKNKDELTLDIEKLDIEITSLETQIGQTKKNILEHSNAEDQHRGKNTLKNSKIDNQKKYQKYLLSAEKDLINSIEHSENIIKEINRFLDNMLNDLSEVESAINLRDKDLEFYEKDISRIDNLIKNNEQHLKKISVEHHQSLNELSSIKDLYPSIKVMLNENISRIYTLLELQVKEKEDLEMHFDDYNEELKNKRVQVAVYDQEISKINEKMKLALESSFFDQKESKDENEWKWEIGGTKLKSYTDLAVLKTNSKQLYSTISALEKEITELKNKHSSLNKVISDSEKMNHKKIMRMEDLCSQLELQITREKNELNEIEKKVYKLENIPINYGNRIEKLKEELKIFKDQEAELELILNDLGRSISSIEEESDRIINENRSVKENSIDLDYTANLGLLMDPNLELNMLPDKPRKDFSYFRLNQMLQGAVLMLITIFSLGSLMKRNEIPQLKDQLPIKKSELNLLKMRQEMKGVVEIQNVSSKNFHNFIKSDIQVSSDIVSILQYLSKKTPKNFQVTDLDLQKTKNNVGVQSGKQKSLGIQITINGFFEIGSEKASSYAQKFKRILSDSGQFKKIDLNRSKKSKGLKTHYTIKMIYE